MTETRRALITGVTGQDGSYLAETRADRLGKVSCGKSCIRFTSLDRVDADELAALVRDAVAATAAGDNAYSSA